MGGEAGGQWDNLDDAVTPQAGAGGEVRGLEEESVLQEEGRSLRAVLGSGGAPAAPPPNTPCCIHKWEESTPSEWPPGPSPGSPLSGELGKQPQAPRVNVSGAVTLREGTLFSKPLSSPASLGGKEAALGLEQAHLGSRSCSVVQPL